MDLFTVKKVMGQAFMPLTLLAILILLGLFWSYKNSKKKAIAAQLTAFILLIGMSNQHLAYDLLFPKEQKFKQYDLSQPVSTVVVLGCGHRNDGMLPVTAQLASCSLYRLTEGMRILKANPGAKLVLSGYGGTEPFSNAEMMQHVAMSLGVPEYRITVIGTPKDTEQEAQAIAPIVKSNDFALVTSASHMPRAMYIFENTGLHPTAAPAGHLAKDISRANWWSHFPDANAIHMVERWWYETLGSWWVALKPG